MVEQTTDAVLGQLLKSQLITSTQWGTLRRRAPRDPQAALHQLVRESVLTRWQASQFARGRRAFTLSKYLLLEKLGSGGMGAVYKARQVNLGRIVAIKLLSLPEDNTDSAIARFQREIQSQSALSHPHIVQALDAGQAANCHYLVMEYVPGKDLRAWIHDFGRLPLQWSCECILQAARGLDHAFQRGWVHRDIKPSNLLVVANSPQARPHLRILDLGLARSITRDPAAMADLTGTREVLGSIDYIAPEVCSGSRFADTRSDIFSLGCTLYRLLTGHLPYQGDSVVERVLSRMRPAPLVRGVRADVPVELEQALCRMMAVDPADRPQTPAEVIKLLTPYGFPSRTTNMSEFAKPPVVTNSVALRAAAIQAIASEMPNRAPMSASAVLPSADSALDEETTEDPCDSPMLSAHESGVSAIESVVPSNIDSPTLPNRLAPTVTMPAAESRKSAAKVESPVRASLQAIVSRPPAAPAFTGLGGFGAPPAPSPKIATPKHNAPKNTVPQAKPVLQAKAVPQAKPIPQAKPVAPSKPIPIAKPAPQAVRADLAHGTPPPPHMPRWNLANGMHRPVSAVSSSALIGALKSPAKPPLTRDEILAAKQRKWGRKQSRELILACGVVLVTAVTCAWIVRAQAARYAMPNGPHEVANEQRATAKSPAAAAQRSNSSAPREAKDAIVRTTSASTTMTRVTPATSASLMKPLVGEDLLAPFRESREGDSDDARHWEGGKLLLDGTQSTGRAHLEFPTSLPTSYRLTMLIDRTGRRGPMLMLLPTSAGRTMLWIDRDRQSGLTPVAKRLPELVTSHYQNTGDLVSSGRLSKITVTVRPNQLDVDCDGRSLVRHQGDLGGFTTGDSGPGNRQLALTTWASTYRLHECRLETLGTSDPSLAPREARATPSSTQRR